MTEHYNKLLCLLPCIKLFSYNKIRKLIEVN